MQSALDRRQAITEVLSDRRFETIENLMAEFSVSRSTIKRDLEILGCSVPIYTVKGNGGGIRVADGWYVGRRYLRSEQEQLLRELMDGLQPDQQKTMQSILSAFAMPKVKETKN
jgi:predicted DNA-binding transcriptional regulator YafY